MNVQSLGLRTDIALLLREGAVDPLGDALCARTPANPDFYYGNMLLFPDAPRPVDVETWPRRFAAAFAGEPRVRHVCLAWDRPDGEEGVAEEFAARGYSLDRTVVFTAKRPAAPHPNRDVRVARVESDADWAAVEALQVATMVADYGPHARPFAIGRTAAARRWVEAGAGFWLAAWDGAELAGDLGLFRAGDLGRYQAVETAPAHRGRGICGTLLQEAAAQAAVDTLVLVALAETPAARLYEACGFRPTERLTAVMRRP